MTTVRWIEDSAASSKFPFWTRANAGEVFPHPVSPLGWDLVFATGILHGWADCGVERLGMGRDEMDPVRPEVMGIFGGYGYLGATFTRVWAERTPGMSAGAIDAAYFGDHPDVPPYIAEPWHERPQTTEHMEGWLGWVMTATEQPELAADRDAAAEARSSRPDLSRASAAELLARARSYEDLIRRMFNQHINQSAAASIGVGVVGAVAEAMGDPSIALKAIGSLGDVDSAAPSHAMWTLSRLVRNDRDLVAAFDRGPGGLTERLRSMSGAATFMQELDAFLVDFGSRGTNEWDVHADTWETNPDLVLALIDRMRLADDDTDPAAGSDGRDGERVRLVESVSAALESDPETQGQFVAAAASAAMFVPGRERSKTSIIRVIHEIRVALFELATRNIDEAQLERVNDICLLFDDELDQFSESPADFAEVIAERRAHLGTLDALEPPFIINGSPPPVDTWVRRADKPALVAAVPGSTITGVAGCPGIMRGTARIILDPSDPTALGPGEILVAPHTDPAWTPLFVSAGAVVVDVGAPLSHAIIVSREFGLPCVVSATDATRRIPDGAQIEVDGTSGVVTIL